MFDLMILAAVGQAVLAAPSTDNRLTLWQSLREGMSAEETAAALRLIDGVKAVSLKPSKKGPVLNVSYTPEGIVVSGLTQKVVLTFKVNRLEAVTLQSNACLGLATEKYKTLRELLKQKYGASRTQREVTEDKTLVAMRDTFDTTPTRVMLRLEPGDIPQHVYASGSVGKLLAQIANDAADAEIQACPNDAGQKATIELTYLDNANSAAIDMANKAQELERRERDKNKL